MQTTNSTFIQHLSKCTLLLSTIASSFFPSLSSSVSLSLQKHFPISSRCIQFCSFIPPSSRAHSLSSFFFSFFSSFFTVLLLSQLSIPRPPFSLEYRRCNLPCLMLSIALNNNEIAPVPSHHWWRHSPSLDLIRHHGNLLFGNSQSDGSCEMQCFHDWLPIVLIERTWGPATSAGLDQYAITFTQGKRMTIHVLEWTHRSVRLTHTLVKSKLRRRLLVWEASIIQ